MFSQCSFTDKGREKETNWLVSINKMWISETGISINYCKYPSNLHFPCLKSISFEEFPARTCVAPDVCICISIFLNHLFAMCGSWQQQHSSFLHSLWSTCCWPVFLLFFSWNYTWQRKKKQKNTTADNHSSSIIKHNFVDMVIIIRNLTEGLHGGMTCHNCSDHKCMLYCLYKVFMLYGWCAQNVSRQQHWYTAWLIRVIKI